MQRFLSELQRRKVLRVAAAYVVASWIILQIAATLENTLTLPAWFDTVIFSFLVVGFPLALVATWLFEFTSEGIKRTVTSGGGGTLKPQTADFILAGMLGLVVLVAIVQLSTPRDGAPAANPVTAEAPKPKVESALSDAPATVEIPEASIAVLPFENLSTDKANAFFTIGIQDEILTRLAKIGSLKVISRTSTAHLSSRPDNLSEIAKRLGVANILEGSVQREGNAIRVNVQLIKASTDGHLWAEIYDRKLDNIFAVQSEIAISIANALSAKVTGEEKKAIALKPTGNTAAYDAYLRGLTHSRQRFSTNERAAKSLNEAVRLDPDFALARALLARVEAHTYFAYLKTDAQRTAARKALDTALRLQPGLAEVHLAQGFYWYYVELDYERARRQFEQVHAKWPNDIESVAALGYIAKRQGRWDDSKSYLAQAISLDPLRADLKLELAGVLSATRDFAAALRSLDSVLNLQPDNVLAIERKADIFLALGRLDEAGALLKALPARPEDYPFLTITRQAVFQRQYGEAITNQQSLLDQKPDNLIAAGINRNLGYLRSLSGDTINAAKNYEQARIVFLAEAARQPKNPGLFMGLALVYRGLGDREISLMYVDKAIGLQSASKDAFSGPIYEQTRARIWAHFGDHDLAIPELARLLKVPSAYPLTPAILRLDPDFDKLRSDPRFEALLKE